jgi:hypothetical protein
MLATGACGRPSAPPVTVAREILDASPALAGAPESCETRS